MTSTKNKARRSNPSANDKRGISNAILRARVDALELMNDRPAHRAYWLVIAEKLGEIESFLAGIATDPVPVVVHVPRQNR